MAETHINAFIHEVEVAYQDCLKAVDNFKARVEALKQKYEGKIKELAPEVQADAQADLKTAEDQAKQLEQDAAGGDQKPAKKAAA